MTRALTIAGLVLFLLVILVPFWWIASMSFKTYEQIQFASSIYVPKPFTWENYTGLWSETRFPLWLRNSVVTALVVTLISTVVAALAGDPRYFTFLTSAQGRVELVLGDGRRQLRTAPDGAYDLLERLGYSCLTPRPLHEKSDPAAMEHFKANAPLL